MKNTTFKLNFLYGFVFPSIKDIFDTKLRIPKIQGPYCSVRKVSNNILSNHLWCLNRKQLLNFLNLLFETVNRHIVENGFWTKCRKWFQVIMAKKYFKNIDLVQNADFFSYQFHLHYQFFLPLTYLKINNASEEISFNILKKIFRSR